MFDDEKGHITLCDWFVGNQIVHCTIGSISLTFEAFEVQTFSLRAKVWVIRDRHDAWKRKQSAQGPAGRRSTGCSIEPRSSSPSDLLFRFCCCCILVYCCPILLPLPMYMYCHILCTSEIQATKLEPPIYRYHSLISTQNV